MAIDFPSSPTNGQIYTYLGRTWVFSTTNNVWQAQAGLTPGFYSQTTAPTGVKEGDEWYDESTGIFYRYINDGDSSQWVEIGPVVNNYPVLRGHIAGLTLSNNGSDATNDIDIAAGQAADASALTTMKLTSALTKRLDASWAVGTNQGGLDTGSIADGWYHMWLIQRPDTGVVDVLFSTSATSPTMPANYIYKRRIGSVRRVSSALVAFSQRGDEFLWLVQKNDNNNTGPSTTGTLYTLSVPTGIKVISRARYSQNSGLVAMLYTSPDQTDTAVDTTSSFTSINLASAIQAMVMEIRTNTSGQIRARATAAVSSFIIDTIGWIDSRGKDD